MPTNTDSMKLKELLHSVKEKNLTKEQVSEYFDDLTHIYSAVCLELSDLKKKEALFFAEALDRAPEYSDARVKRMFRSSQDGLRLIELEAYKMIIPRELSSLKNRIYNLL